MGDLLLSILLNDTLQPYCTVPKRRTSVKENNFGQSKLDQVSQYLTLLLALSLFLCRRFVFGVYCSEIARGYWQYIDV